MDAKQFDALVARLGRGPSRREALKGLAAGALSAVGLAEGALGKGKSARKQSGKGKGKGHPPVLNSRRCDCPGGPGGKKKKKGKGKGLAPCGQCASGFFTRQPNGVCHCACRPEATTCDPAKPFQCCSGICTNGLCADYGG
jgi:hypothetical protein